MKNKLEFLVLALSLPFFVFFLVAGAEAKTKPALTLSVEKEIVAGEPKVKISGSVTPVKADVRVKIFRKPVAKKSFKKFATVRTNANGEFSYYTTALALNAKSIRAVTQVKGRDPGKTIPYNFSELTTGDITILAPYANEREVDNVPEAFSSSAAGPWGFTHVGIDFIPIRDLVPFQAVIDGEITNFSCGENSLPMGWHCGFCIEQWEFKACYNFEVFSDSDELGASQQANIFFSEGDQVSAGDIVGYLVQGGESAHLDFGVIPIEGASRSCPQPYFTTDAYDSIMRVIHADHPTWEMCYE